MHHIHSFETIQWQNRKWCYVNRIIFHSCIPWSSSSYISNGRTIVTRKHRILYCLGSSFSFRTNIINGSRCCCSYSAVGILFGGEGCRNLVTCFFPQRPLNGGRRQYQNGLLQGLNLKDGIVDQGPSLSRQGEFDAFIPKGRLILLLLFHGSIRRIIYSNSFDKFR